MKRITTILFLIHIVGQTNAQYLVIGDSNLGGNNIPFQDTIISSYDSMGCSSFNYYLDIDQDSIPDIHFYLDCYIGGLGNSFEISLTTSNDFSIHIDTSYIEHFQFINSNGQVQDTTRRTSVVKKYNFGDTIFSNQVFCNTEGTLLNYSSGHYPPCVYNNVVLFLEDTSYIALEKSNGDLFYFKIYMCNKSTLELIHGKTNALLSIGELTTLQSHIFPNPATNVIHFKDNYDSIEIYSTEGTLLIERKKLGAHKNIDISSLKSGFYIVVLKKDKYSYTTKLLKM